MKIQVMMAAMLAVVATCEAAHADNETDKAEILKMEQVLANAPNLEVAMQWHDPNVICYDWERGIFKGYDAVKKHFAGLFAEVPSADVKIEDISIETDGQLAVANSVQHVVAKDAKTGKVTLDSVFRTTDAYHRVNGKWLLFSQHNSFPIELASGKAVISVSP
jgi:ketosteroid isomerase-like protein